MFVLGVTGGIGSGKTVVTDIFSELNIDVIDADIASRKAVEKGSPCLQEIENYFGIEVRGAVLEEGKKELSEHGLEHKKPQLICFDQFSELSFDHKFDVLFAFSVLIHMKDEIVEKCIAFVSSVIDESGAFYANVNIVSYSDNNWQGFPVVFRSMEFYENLAKKNGLSVNAVGTLAELGHSSGQELGDKQVMLCFKKK